MKPFIQDNERVLNATTDLLKTSVCAENLEKVIENTPQDRVFTIGVFGGWGTGKSSIIRTAQDNIEKKHEDVKFITYDAWKYANDSFRRMFLLKVQQELKMQQTEEMARFYQSEMAEAEPKTTLSAKGVAVAVVVVAVISIILFLTPISIEWKVAVPTIGTLGTFLLALLNGLFYDLKISYSKPALFAPEQFEACFKEMMSKCLKRKNWYQKTWSAIKDYVEVGEVSVVGLEKLVIVIDNIDRCPSDMAYQLLTDIKTFLSNEKYNLVFVVPVDDEALKKHLFRRWNKSNDIEVNKEKEEFLRKFFNVTLRIKPHQETELLHFAHEINTENKLGLNSDTLAIVAKEFADNPRRIIQLLNNLSGDLALYEDDFAQEHETAICAALILHEEYSSFYKRATKDLDLVRKFSAEVAKDKDGSVSASLEAFMRVASVNLKKTPLEALQRIFTNTSSIFSDLPADIQKAVTTYDTEKVIAFAETHEGQKANLVDYAIEKLKTEIKYGATSQTTQWLYFFSQLFKAGLFESSRFADIDASLSPYYKAAIPLIQDQDTLNYLGSGMSKAGFTSLRSAVIEILTEEKASEQGVTSSELLEGYLKHYTSKQDCDDIAAVVDNYYIDNTIDKEFAFTDTQIKNLFGDAFVAIQIENLPATDDEARIEDITWCIEQNKELSGETFIKLFDKYVELFGATRGKSKEEYLTLINNLQPIFAAIGSAALQAEPQSLYDVVTGTRGIPHPSYPNQPNRDTQRAIFEEVDEEEAKVVTSFCYEIYRISGGKVDVSNSVSELYAQCKDAVMEGALRAHALSISIKSLAPTLIIADNYESATDISVLEVLLTRQADGSFMLDNATIKTKVNDLVNHAANKNVETLLAKLVKDKQILDDVAEYVASLDSEAINTLPVSISKYAVSTFSRENAETYKDNTDFLTLVLKKGNATQKKEVVRLMKAKINAETDLAMVVSVLDNLATEDQNMLRTLVGELEGIKDSDAVSDEDKTRVAALAVKLSGSIKKPGMIDKLLGKK